MAKAATHGASKNFKIEVSVTNGFKAGAEFPIPVVPVEVSTSSLTCTKLTVEIDLNNFNPVEFRTGLKEDQVLFLDTKTGILTSQSPPVSE